MPNPAPHVDQSAFLRALAGSLGLAVADEGGGLLAHVSPSPDGAGVGILPLDGRAPADVLLGAVAPEHWSALGVATSGWAHALDRPRDPAVRAQVVVLVARDGEIVSRVRHGDEVLTEPPASGLTLDCLQLALGLPTAAPEVPPSQLLAIAWLQSVLQNERSDVPWAELDELHAAWRGSGLDWERLRWMVIEGRWEEPDLSPADAAWLDDGAFSRRVLSQRPPLSELLAALARLVGRSDSRRCAHRLRRMGVG